MAGVDFIEKPFRYPIGPSRWSNKPETEFNDGKSGFYEIKFTAPKYIRFPVLPRKEKKKLIWSLKDGHGIYFYVDIEDAKECGYTVEFINECLVWDDSSTTLFDKYITFWFEIKQQCDSPYKYDDECKLLENLNNGNDGFVFLKSEEEKKQA